jgi:hypothetical protein
MAPIQGTGEEYRSRTSCVVDRGMAYPSGFVAGSTTLSVTALAQVVGRWWDRINQLAQWLSAQQDALRQKTANGGIGLPTNPRATVCLTKLCTA